MAKPNYNQIVKLLAPGAHHRTLFISEQYVISIYKYRMIEGRQIAHAGNEPDDASFDGYGVYVHGGANFMGHTVGYVTKEQYMEAILLAKDSVSTWLFSTLIQAKRKDPIPRKWMVAVNDQARHLFNQDLKKHWEQEDPKRVSLAYVAGEACTVNGLRDVGIEFEARAFIGAKCTIVRQRKDGLYEVSLDSDPKTVWEFSKFSLSHVSKATR